MIESFETENQEVLLTSNKTKINIDIFMKPAII